MQGNENDKPQSVLAERVKGQFSWIFRTIPDLRNCRLVLIDYRSQNLYLLPVFGGIMPKGME
jgi:hypothetical protein